MEDMFGNYDEQGGGYGLYSNEGMFDNYSEQGGGLGEAYDKYNPGEEKKREGEALEEKKLFKEGLLKTVKEAVNAGKKNSKFDDQIKSVEKAISKYNSNKYNSKEVMPILMELIKEGGLDQPKKVTLVSIVSASEDGLEQSKEATPTTKPIEKDNSDQKVLTDSDQKILINVLLRYDAKRSLGNTKDGLDDSVFNSLVKFVAEKNITREPYKKIFWKIFEKDDFEIQVRRLSPEMVSYLQTSLSKLDKNIFCEYRLFKVVLDVISSVKYKNDKGLEDRVQTLDNERLNMILRCKLSDDVFNKLFETILTCSKLKRIDFYGYEDFKMILDQLNPEIIPLFRNYLERRSNEPEIQKYRLLLEAIVSGNSKDKVESNPLVYELAYKFDIAIIKGAIELLSNTNDITIEDKEEKVKSKAKKFLEEVQGISKKPSFEVLKVIKNSNDEKLTSLALAREFDRATIEGLLKFKLDDNVKGKLEMFLAIYNSLDDFGDKEKSEPKVSKESTISESDSETIILALISVLEKEKSNKEIQEILATVEKKRNLDNDLFNKSVEIILKRGISCKIFGKKNFESQVKRLKPKTISLLKKDLEERGNKLFLSALEIIECKDEKKLETIVNNLSVDMLKGILEFKLSDIEKKEFLEAILLSREENKLGDNNSLNNNNNKFNANEINENTYQK